MIEDGGKFFLSPSFFVVVFLIKKAKYTCHVPMSVLGLALLNVPVLSLPMLSLTNCVFIIITIYIIIRPVRRISKGGGLIGGKVGLSLRGGLIWGKSGPKPKGVVLLGKSGPKPKGVVLLGKSGPFYYIYPMELLAQGWGVFSPPRLPSGYGPDSL